MSGETCRFYIKGYDIADALNSNSCGRTSLKIYG